MKAAFFYLMYAFRRFTRASATNPLGEVQAQFAMLWTQTSLTICFISFLFRRQFAEANPYAVGIAVFTALYVMNRPLFSREADGWRTCSARFAALSGETRTIADFAATAFFLTSVIVMPVLVKWLKTGSI